MGGAFPGPHARHPSPGAAVQHRQGPVPAEPRLVPLSRAPQPCAQAPDCSSGEGAPPSASVKLAVLLSPPPRPMGSLFTAALHPRDPARAPPLCLCLITGDHSPPLQPFPSVCQKRWDISSACLSSAHSLPQDSTHEGPWGAAGSFLSAVPMTAQEPHASCALLGDVSQLWVMHVPGPPGTVPGSTSSERLDVGGLRVPPRGQHGENPVGCPFPVRGLLSSHGDSLGSSVTS